MCSPLQPATLVPVKNTNGVRSALVQNVLWLQALQSALLGNCPQFFLDKTTEERDLVAIVF
jgi:hypothetical protein